MISNPAYMYQRVLRLISNSPEERSQQELLFVEVWFRKKSKLLDSLHKETLLDVIRHCDFVTKDKDEVIIHQGETGHRFYIILRGTVSILHKDSLEDVDLGEEGTNHASRESLGSFLATLGEGSTFGEIALINPDCIRTASVIADGKTDLVVISRDLYNRSVSKVVAREYMEKISFIESLPLLRGWQPNFRKQLAACFKKEVYPFDCTLVKQGDTANTLYFIVSGEVKLMVDPEGHFQQYKRMFDKCSDLISTEGKTMETSDRAYFPQKFLPQMKKFSRVNRTHLLPSDRKRDNSPNGAKQIPQAWSPSAIRKMNLEIHSKRINLNLCLLGEKQFIGDVEFLLQLDTHHASAICSQETTVFQLSKAHFDRLFRKRNPSTLKPLARNTELLLTRRIMAPNIVDSVPMIKYFVYKLKEQLGEINKGTVGSTGKFNLPEITLEGSKERSSSSPKAYFWSSDISHKTRPGMSAKQELIERMSNGLASPALPH